MLFRSDKDAAYMEEKTGYKKRVSDESTKLASFDAVENLNPLMNIYYENMTKLATQYPLLTGSANLATGALNAMAGAALLNLPGGLLPKIGGVLPKVSGVLPKAGKLLKRGGVAGAVAGVGGYALDAGFGEDSAVARYGSSALNGASAGALFGSFVPVLGTAVGAAIGGSLGLLIEAMKSPVLKSPEPAKVETTIKIMPSPDFRVQSQTTKTSGPVKNTIHTGNLRYGVP